MSNTKEMTFDEMQRHDATMSLTASFKQQDISRKLNELTQKEPKIAFVLEEYINVLIGLRFDQGFVQGRMHELRKTEETKIIETTPVTEGLDQQQPQ